MPVTELDYEFGYNVAIQHQTKDALESADAGTFRYIQGRENRSTSKVSFRQSRELADCRPDTNYSRFKGDFVGMVTNVM